MKKTISFFLLIGSCLGLALFTDVASVNAEEAQTGIGGAVQTNGVIGFYEDTTEPSTSGTAEPTTPTGTPEDPQADGGDSVTKPVGKFPSTGELVAKSATISGIVLVLIGCFLFILRQKKKKAEGE